MKCEFKHEAWGPNEGCKEFMDEPEMIPCGEVAKWVCTDEFEGDMGAPDIVFLCTEHKELLVKEDGWIGTEREL